MDFRAQQLDFLLHYIQKAEKCVLMTIHTGSPPQLWTIQEELYIETTQMPIEISTDFQFGYHMKLQLVLISLQTQILLRSL